MMRSDIDKSMEAVKKADVVLRIRDNDEIKVLADLIEDKWILMWCDMKLKEAADRLVSRGLVRVMGEDKEGPQGRYELWPIIRKRIILTGATTVFMDNYDIELVAVK